MKVCNRKGRPLFPRKILGIETSCDDTSAAVVTAEGVVLSSVAASQDAEHEVFGGVVPEIASRNHTYHLLAVIEKALLQAQQSWEDIDAIAVTNRPGLIGSLMVGVVTAKTLAYCKNKPLIGVNHLEGHLLAPFLRDSQHQPASPLQFPYLALTVSGGHSSLYFCEDLGNYQVLGTTIDDAAGEAFDKFAKMAGLGYPGGVQVDRYAQQGNPAAYPFPRALMQKKARNLNFSFSGLKTQAQLQLQKMSDAERRDQIHDLCASYQEAIVDALLTKLDWAYLNQQQAGRAPALAVITGGVSANSRLRAKAEAWAAKRSLVLAYPPLRYCTDNAAMIAYAGALRLQRGERSDWRLGASARSLPGDLSCSS